MRNSNPARCVLLTLTLTLIFYSCLTNKKLLQDVCRVLTDMVPGAQGSVHQNDMFLCTLLKVHWILAAFWLQVLVSSLMYFVRFTT